ncbi:hypothetical protein P0R31_40095 [Bradyrhizobium yuanmingense]|uniref:hypothetical protein n=1 Tax=Bradyrhizobium yuanmingense TaxID=108015 RepID=UPI0023B8A8C9|nr:hypothetical protein [Bradyrhizobium yuanmingense]MDF0523378.1 hypothetical protein [Bradyrhizobium yuanmingense]
MTIADLDAANNAADLLVDNDGEESASTCPTLATKFGLLKTSNVYLTKPQSKAR